MPLTNAGSIVCLSGPGLVSVPRFYALYVGDPVNAAGVEVNAAGYARLERTAVQQAVANNVVTVAAGGVGRCSRSKLGPSRPCRNAHRGSSRRSSRVGNDRTSFPWRNHCG